MTASRPAAGRVGLAVVLASSLCLWIPWQARGQSERAAEHVERLELVGDYRYAFHPPMSLAEAKNIAYTEAVRMAIDRSRVFLESTASVTDQSLLNHIRQIIASGYLKDVQVIEQPEKERTVYVKVRATVNPEEIKAVIVREVNRQGEGSEPPGLDQNRALKILSVREENDGTVAIVFKALQRLDWLSTAYDGSLRESADLMIDFFDENGVPIISERLPARKAAIGEILNPGQIGVQKVTKPPRTRSYRAWLVK